jgi:hypothetical protein
MKKQDPTKLPDGRPRVVDLELDQSLIDHAKNIGRLTAPAVDRMEFEHLLMMAFGIARHLEDPLIGTCFGLFHRLQQLRETVNLPDHAKAEIERMESALLDVTRENQRLRSELEYNRGVTQAKHGYVWSEIDEQGLPVEQPPPAILIAKR